MRVWDIPPILLCNQHLLGEHNEIHAILSIIKNNKQGYRNHPEVNRWRGHLDWLWVRHEYVETEMTRRGMNHQSPFPIITYQTKPPNRITSRNDQLALLKTKPCSCPLEVSI